MVQNGKPLFQCLLGENEQNRKIFLIVSLEAFLDVKILQKVSIIWKVT